MAETTRTRTAGATDYELHYFEGIRGAAQPIRWILIDANASWNEKLVPYDQWDSKYKADESFSGTFRTLPVLLVKSSNTRISQMLTIVSYLGRKLNYYGTDTSPEGIARCDSICSAAVLDVALPLTKFLHVFARFPDLEFNTLYNEYVPKIENVLKRLDYLLGTDNFFCGDKISTADLVVFEAYECALLIFGPIIAAKYPRLDKLHDRIRDRPNIKAWREAGNMESDITLSVKYKEYLRLMRERFAADNSNLENLSAGGKKKLEETKQFFKGKKQLGEGGAGMKGKKKDVGEGMKGKKFEVGEGEGAAAKGKAGKQAEKGAAGKAGVGVPLKTGVKGK